MKEGFLMCIGFFLMASDCIPVVLVGILLLGAAGFLAGAYSGEAEKQERISAEDIYEGLEDPKPALEEYPEQEEKVRV